MNTEPGPDCETFKRVGLRLADAIGTSIKEADEKINWILQQGERHDIRWAAEQMEAGHAVLDPEGVQLQLMHGMIAEKDGSDHAFSATNLLATDWELVEQPAQPTERKCGECRRFEPGKASLYHDTCYRNYSLRIHRESVACKDWECLS